MGAPAKAARGLRRRHRASGLAERGRQQQRPGGEHAGCDGRAAAQPFESVADDMRRNSQQRLFDEEAEKWMKEIRQKARITIYPDPTAIPADRKPVPLPPKPAA